MAVAVKSERGPTSEAEKRSWEMWSIVAILAASFFGLAALVMVLLLEVQLLEIPEPSASRGLVALNTDLVRLELRQVLRSMYLIVSIGATLAGGLVIWLGRGLIAYHTRRLAELGEAGKLLDDAERALDDGDASRALELVEQAKAIGRPTGIEWELSALVAQRAAAERVGRDLQDLTANVLASVRRIVQAEPTESWWVRWGTIFQGVAVLLAVVGVVVAYLTWRS